MKRHLIKGLSASVLLATGVFASGGATAATLNDIYQVAERINDQARQSQARIDALTEETRQLLSEYKTVLKEIEGLRVYNRQLERQIENQETEMAQLTRSIDEVTLIERQITPLMLRMIDGLEQFVELDMPFLLDERMERIETLRSMMDRADVAVSEKFSQILRAYQIENEYGRTMEAYDDTIAINGTERKVDILKVGRVALVYQSGDGTATGHYNTITSQWEPLGEEYNTPVRNGIRMARQQLSVDMLPMPVRGPETVPGPQGNQSAQAARAPGAAPQAAQGSEAGE
jgi:predicted RNase H-like nuclease (RuvC/YqgF family)